MIKDVYVRAIGLAASLALCTRVEAQANLVYSGSPVLAAQEQSVSSLLAQRIDVQLSNTTLEQALTDIGEKAGTKISFAPHMIAKVAPVTVRGAQITVEQALRQALQKTALQFTLYEGRIAIVAKPAAIRQGTIVGKVLHAKTRQPVVGARVYLNDSQESVTTGSDGTFRLTVEAGEHQLHIGMSA